MAVAFAMASLFIAGIASLRLLCLIALYLVLQLSYSLYLKKIPILDIALVASGFLLRAVAGGVACDIALSQWFLLVTSFGSLFVVAGKRYSELKQVGTDGATRISLRGYTPSFLHSVSTMSMAIVIVCYGLWAFREGQPQVSYIDWDVISVAPLTLALLRYSQLIDQGLAGEPESVLLHDRLFQLLTLSWLVSAAVSVLSAR
jgi:decaprenyl-phosphate phosphoribosyltransferase